MVNQHNEPTDNPCLKDKLIVFPVKCIESFSSVNKKIWKKGANYTCLTKDFKTFMISTDIFSRTKTLHETRTSLVTMILPKAHSRVQIDDDVEYININQYQFDDYFTTDYRVTKEPIPFRWMSSRIRDDAYREVWCEHVYEDVIARAKDTDTELAEGVAEQCAYRYVYEGDYDCNFDYWTNLDNLIDEENTRRG